jgi:esterase/lipase superfamily enzyme
MRSATIKGLLAAVLLWTIAVDRGFAACGEVWLVNTRNVCDGCASVLETQPLQFWRLEKQCQWAAADLATLLRSDRPAVPTVVFVPGYDSNLDDGPQMVWPLYEQLGCDPGNRPFRVIVWSWPAERSVHGIRADMQSKAARTEVESLLLGQFLDRVQPQVPLTLVGFSFGARIIAGSLEFLGGGQVGCCGLARQNTAPRVPMRAILVAAGMDSDWLLPGHRDGDALSQVDQMLITVNDADWVLRLYSRLYQRNGPEALGYHGPACVGNLGAEQAKLDMLDVTCAVGRNHHWAHYVECSGVLSRIGPYTFRLPMGATAAAKENPTAAKAKAVEGHKSVAANN